MMTYEEALNYIHGISWTFCKPGLERTRELCGRMNNPQDRLKFIHVAGTNGKGSFCSMLTSVLMASGLKVGTYTSPYILRFNERMQVDGEPISDGMLAEICEEIRPHADAMADRPTEFELITVIAFEFFRRMKVDVVVLECGMGGRLDSTNVIVNPLLSVITGISLDHTAFLGDTVEKIAAEKAGIIKSSSPVIYGGEDDSARAIIEAKAEEFGSPYYEVDYSCLNITKSDLSGTNFDYKSHTGMHISLLGSYQPRNASLVLSAIEVLRSVGISIPEKSVKAGLSAAKWRARFEVVSKNPLIIFDGAHNPEGVEAAVLSIKEYFHGKKIIAISGVLSDKDYEYIGGEIASVAKMAYTITPSNPRALLSTEYAKIYEKNGVSATPCESIDEALALAKDEAMKENTPIICLGSLYTYGDVISALKK